VRNPVPKVQADVGPAEDVLGEPDEVLAERVTNGALLEEGRQPVGERLPDSGELHDIIDDLAKVEPNGIPSRYPKAIDGKDIHPPLSTVDFERFVHAIKRAQDTLRTWLHELDRDAGAYEIYLRERHRTHDEEISPEGVDRVS